MTRGKVFIVNERQAKILSEGSCLTHYRFVNNVGKFLESLLQDPINSKPGYELESNGLDRRKLLGKLIDRGIVKRQSKLTEIDGKSVIKVKYTVPKEGFKEKLNRLYIDITGDNVGLESKPINEDGESGGAISGGDCGFGCDMANSGSGATTCSTVSGDGKGMGFIQPISNQIITRGSFYATRGKKKKKK